MDADNKLYDLLNVNRNATDTEIKKVSIRYESDMVLRTNKILIETCGL